MWIAVEEKPNIGIDKHENDARLLIRSCNVSRNFMRDCKNKIIFKFSLWLFKIRFSYNITL